MNELQTRRDSTSVVAIFDTGKFEHMQRIAKLMVMLSTLPDHLKSKSPDFATRQQETLSNCFLIVNQSERWNADPFAVAPETYIARNRLGYSGKLVGAIVNTRAGLEANLSYEFSGEGDGRTVRVIGRFKGADKDKDVSVTVGDVKTDHPMWKSDPDQKLVYNGNIKWARRHAPEVMLGILTIEDLELMEEKGELIDVTPPRPARAAFAPESDPPPKPARKAKAAGTPSAPSAPSAPPTPDEPHGPAFYLTTPDGETLHWDDPADFPTAYKQELENAYAHYGLAGADGFVETNQPALAAFAKTTKAGAAELEALITTIRGRAETTAGSLL